MKKCGKATAIPRRTVYRAQALKEKLPSMEPQQRRVLVGPLRICEFGPEKAPPGGPSQRAPLGAHKRRNSDRFSILFKRTIFLKIVGERKKLSDAAGANRRCKMKIEQQGRLRKPLIEMKSEDWKGKARQRTCRGHPPSGCRRRLQAPERDKFFVASPVKPIGQPEFRTDFLTGFNHSLTSGRLWRSHGAGLGSRFSSLPLHSIYLL